MVTRTVTIKPDTPELAALCDAIRRAEGSSILESALSQYVSRMIVSTLADKRFLTSLRESSGEAEAKQERIRKLREELAKLEAE
ncbi:hypothetical protein [Pseudomonas sp. ZL2]